MENKQKNLRYSVRIEGRVTSIYIKKSIIALYIVICCPLSSNDPTERDFILENIYSILDGWKESTAKGLSEYITSQILADIAGEYSNEYFSCLKSLE